MPKKEKKLNTPINKGNYSMESDERNAEFEKKRGFGCQEEYKKNRQEWTENPQNFFVADYPLLVDLELSSVCNLRCPMCYTISDDFKNQVNTGLMGESLFKKIIDEISGKVFAIRLSLRGEPFLHPKIIELIEYAKAKGIKEVSTLTNGSLLKEKTIQEMIKAGLDWITISVDGVGKTYERIRRPNKFTDILDRIKLIQNTKQTMNSVKPVVKIQSIWPAISADPEEFYNTFAPFVDQIAFNPLIDYHIKDDKEKIVYDEDFSCPQIYQRLVIGSDGGAMMCANDQLNLNCVGDATKESIYDIWHGEKMNKIRMIHKQKGGFCKNLICAGCYLPRATFDEKVKFKGRDLIVKNYVGRSQVIGK